MQCVTNSIFQSNCQITNRQGNDKCFLYCRSLFLEWESNNLRNHPNLVNSFKRLKHNSSLIKIFRVSTCNSNKFHSKIKENCCKSYLNENSCDCYVGYLLVVAEV